MGVYAKYVLPRFIDFSMRNKDAARIRAEWVPHARGDVLEVGIGSGLNLPLYSREVRLIYGVDPSLELQKIARQRLSGQAIKVDFLSQSAERTLPLSDKSIDTVVMTWTLCSIANPLRALQEMKRVLKPSGRLIFVEHGRSPDSKVAAWQDRLTPVWKRIGGGCHLNRKVDALLAEAGFTIDELKTTYLRGPRPMTFTYQGFARREA
ncbi:MAG TPA: class I SAM-dependent methyltransferase [Candidatus Acidoferrum sp.]|nr:class I SAM-dependent methyltransferase [Candidatus Acidoferrum sp.]